MLFKTQFRSIRMKPSKKQQIVNFQIHNTHTTQLNDIHFVQKGDLFIEKENGHSTFKVNMKNTCARERERYMEEVLGRGSIGKCISEWFPMLREHSATWVSNFDSIIRLFVVRGRNHEADHRRVHLEWPQSCQDPHSVHRRLEQPRISPETCRTVWKPHPCPQPHPISVSILNFL